MHSLSNTQQPAERIKGISSVFHRRLSVFLSPLLGLLDERLDRRLVHTFSLLVEAIIRFRHRQHGLLLSELGAYLLSPDKAPAGTKRISNLLRSGRWHYGLVSDWLRAQAKAQLAQWPAQPVLLHWDESVVEKPESVHPQGLCPVRSAKARRLVRIRPGFFNPPPQRPVHVPGFHWLGLLLMGLHTKPCLYLQEWWSTRLGQSSQQAATLRRRCLEQAARDFGRRVIHVFDRGYAGAPWLRELLRRRQHFILRWNKAYALRDGRGRQLPCWQLVRGKRSLSKRLVRDTPRRQERRMGLYHQAVFHPRWPQRRLSLIVLRPGKGHAPLYLLTNLPVQNVGKAWRVVFCYARRWQVEAAATPSPSWPWKAPGSGSGKTASS
ncbi:transposase [Pontibacter sp. CAU 1760]